MLGLGLALDGLVSLADARVQIVDLVSDSDVGGLASLAVFPLGAVSRADAVGRIGSFESQLDVDVQPVLRVEVGP